MGNRYIAVLRTYFHWPLNIAGGVVAWAGLLMVALTLVTAAHRRRDTFDYYQWALTFSVAVMFLGSLLWTRLREHLTSDRRRIYPRYVESHVVIFAGIRSMLALVWRALMAMKIGGSVLGLTSCTVAICAVAGWTIVQLSMTFSMVWVALSFWFSLGSGLKVTTHLLYGQNNGWAAGLLGVSVVAVAAALVRLLTMTEESVGYEHPYKNGEWNSASQKPERLDRWRNIFTISAPLRRWKFARLANTGQTLLGRSYRWRVGVRPQWWVLIWMALASVMPDWFSHYSNPNASISFSSLIAAGIMPMLPIMIVPYTWYQSRKYLEASLLRPVSRADLLKEIAAAMAVHVLQAWLTVAIICVIGLLLLRAANAEMAIAGLLILTLAAQVFIFGISVWVMRLRSAAPAVLLPMAGMLFPVAIVMGATMQPQQAAWYIGLGSIWLVLAGVYLIRRAYSLWMEVEWGMLPMG